MNVLQKVFLKCCILLHGSLVTSAATTPGRKSEKTGTQDAYFTAEFVQERPAIGGLLRRLVPKRKVACVAVFDGHGETGGEVARLAAEIAEKSIAYGMSCGIRDLKKVLREAVKEVARVLDKSELSWTGGTTGSIVLIRGRKVVMGHVGDSTITLWGKKKKHQLGGPMLKYKSLNHHPDVPQEKLRVVQAGGFIEDSYVVNMETEKALAMTRSFGDITFRKFGCISNADVVEMEITKGETLIVASDGLWDDPCVSMENVQDSVEELKPQQLARSLLLQTEGQGNPWDDTTVVCLTRR